MFDAGFSPKAGLIKISRQSGRGFVAGAQF